MRLGAHTVIDPRVSVRGPVLLGANCRLEAGVTVEPYTVIGDNVTVEQGASLKQAIIWDGVTIGRRAAVRGAVIGCRVILEDNTAVYEGAAVGDGCTVRTFSIVKPEVKIWPEKEIDRYTTVRRNLIWGSRCPRSLFASQGVGGYVHRDLTPALVSQVAAAFGSLLAPGSTVAVSRAPGAGPELLAAAALTGLLTGGLRVFDLGESLLPLHRYAVRALGLAGGLHVRRDPRESDRFILVFSDDRGLPLAGGQRRKVDSAYQQENFRRVKESELLPVTRTTDLEDRYLTYLGACLGGALPSEKTPFFVYTPAPKIFTWLTRLAPALPWELVLVPDIEALRQRLREGMVAGGASFDAEGEELVLWEPGGRALTRQRQHLLLTQVLLAEPRPPLLALPVSAPSPAEALARAANVTVRWVRNEWRAIAEAAWQPPLGGRQVQMLGDALYTFVALAGYLAAQNLTFPQALAALPETWQQARDVPCSWAAKGKVLRQLAEEEESRRVETVDGLKVYREEGWALVLPDADEPFYQVYSEALSPALTESLCREYVERIGRLAQGSLPADRAE